MYHDYPQSRILRFSSPIGAFIFLINIQALYLKIRSKVFVPYRGFYFLNTVKRMQDINQVSVFVPYRGFYFLNLYGTSYYKKSGPVFVPYRGFYFLNNCEKSNKKAINECVFVPYRGFYFLNRRNDFVCNATNKSFRPLSGLLFS